MHEATNKTLEGIDQILVNAVCSDGQREREERPGITDCTRARFNKVFVNNNNSLRDGKVLLPERSEWL
jgi:hypothetical protein